MFAPKNCPQCAAPTSGSVNCAYCGARILDTPTEEYVEDLRGFLNHHDKAIGQHYSPTMWVAVLATLGGPVGGYHLGYLFDWPWATAIGAFLVGAVWFCIAITDADARYARKRFLPPLRDLMARKGYSADVVKRTARTELDESRAEELIKVVEEQL